MIYAYGICEPQAVGPVPARPGIGGARLRVLRADGLAVVYSRHRSLRPRPSPPLVLAHERVVEALMARGPVVPLRFGMQLPGEAELAAAIAPRRDELARALDRVRGRAELGLRVFGNEDPAASEPTTASPLGEGRGRAYLLARAAAHRQSEHAARDLHGPLARLAVASTVSPRPTPPAILVASYLVDADRVTAFRARGDELHAEHPDARFVVTGPWPPYHFVTEEPA